jgi:hypothetical protein
MCVVLSRRQWFGGLMGLLAGWLARPPQATAKPPSIRKFALPPDKGIPGYSISR